MPQMRLLAVLCLAALLLLVWRPFASEEQASYMVFGSGAELCANVASKPGAPADAPLTELARITCELDGALLSLQNYYRDNMVATVADPSDRLIGRLRSGRHKPGR
jgi:hypothetical protein